jgi:glucose-6-phosphate isomerase
MFSDVGLGRTFFYGVVGLTISLAVGYDNFEELLEGEMDTHFKTADFDKICQLYWHY